MSANPSSPSPPGPAERFPGAAGPRVRGALLLEVVVALAIMVAVLAVVGSQMVGGIQMVADAESQTRAGELGDRMMALLDLDQQTQQKVFADLESTGDFGESYPDYMWRVAVEPTEVEGLDQVTLDIVHIDDPDSYGDIEQGKIVRRFHMLKAAPGRIDLVDDFGMNEEQVAVIGQLVPIEGFDPRAMDPQQIASLDPAMLLQLLPQLLPLLQQAMGDKAGGLDLGALAGMDPADISPEALRERFAEQIRGMSDAEAAGDEGGDSGDAGADFGAGDSDGGRGGRGGRRGGDSGTSADSLEELRRLQEQFEAGGGRQGGRGGRRSGGGRSDVGSVPRDGDSGAGGAPRGGGGRGGRNGNRAGGGGRGSGTDGGVPPATLEDLERLRQQFEQNQGGGGRGSGRNAGGGGRGGARGGGRGGGRGGNRPGG